MRGLAIERVCQPDTPVSTVTTEQRNLDQTYSTGTSNFSKRAVRVAPDKWCLRR